MNPSCCFVQHIAFPISGSVRLLNGSHPAEGRVEIYYSNTWGTVCDKGWDIRDANVVCRMLGYRYAIAARSSAYFGGGGRGQTVWFEDVNCRGSEINLLNCSRGSSPSSCRHRSDAGVVCYSEKLNI